MTTDHQPEGVEPPVGQPDGVDLPVGQPEGVDAPMESDPEGDDAPTESEPPSQPGSRLGWVLAAFLIAAATAIWGLWPSAPPPPPLTIAYTRGLSGLLDSSDAEEASAGTLARVAATLKPLQTSPLLLVDLGDSVTGRGAVNASSEGLAMAAGMGACGYVAVLPSERDLWLSKQRLEEISNGGHFPFLLTNARAEAVPEAWRRPLVRDMGGIRVAIFGAFVPPQDLQVRIDGGVALSRNLETLRAALNETTADVRIVLARVRDAGSLARMLPEADVIIPATAGTLQSAQSEPVPALETSLPPRSVAMRRVAPALETSASLGYIRLARGEDGKLEAKFETQTMAAASPDEALEAAAAPFRKAFETKYRDGYAREAARMQSFVPGDSIDAGAAFAEMVRGDLECDVAVLAAGDVSGKLKGIVAAEDVARTVSSGAQVRVLAVTGAEVMGWLKNGAGAAAGVRVWRNARGQVALAKFQGRALESVERLKVAVSLRLSEPGNATGETLANVVQNALLTRPLLFAPPVSTYRMTPAEETALLHQGLVRASAFGTLLDDGSKLAREGHPVEAQALWLSAIALEPQHADVETLLNTMQQATPGEPPSYLELGALEASAGNWREAWEAYEMGTAGYPDNAAYPLAQANLLLRCQQPLGALTMLSQACDKGATPDETALPEGMARLMTGDSAKASAILSRALGAKSAPALKALAGLALFRSGSVNKARAIWSELDRDPLTAAAAEKQVP